MKIGKYIFLLIWEIIALLLYFDTQMFALSVANTTTGRQYGCYTILELLIGVKEPSSIRGIQEILSIVFILLGIILFSLFLITDIKKRKLKKARQL